MRQLTMRGRIHCTVYCHERTYCAARAHRHTHWANSYIPAQRQTASVYCVGGVLYKESLPFLASQSTAIVWKCYTVRAIIESGYCCFWCCSLFVTTASKSSRTSTSPPLPSEWVTDVGRWCNHIQLPSGINCPAQMSSMTETASLTWSKLLRVCPLCLGAH